MFTWLWKIPSCIHWMVYKPFLGNALYVNSLLNSVYSIRWKSMGGHWLRSIDSEQGSFVIDLTMPTSDDGSNSETEQSKVVNQQPLPENRVNKVELYVTVSPKTLHFEFTHKIEPIFRMSETYVHNVSCQKLIIWSSYILVQNNWRLVWLLNYVDI